jgi:hypothetical protein
MSNSDTGVTIATSNPSKETNLYFSKGTALSDSLAFGWQGKHSTNEVNFFKNGSKVSTWDNNKDFHLKDSGGNTVFFFDYSYKAIGIGQNSISSKAVFDIASTTKGMLIPRMTTTQRDAITSVPDGLLIYNTDFERVEWYDGAGWTSGKKSATKTADYTALVTDSLIVCDTTSGSITITLPAVSNGTEVELTIKRSGGNSVTVDGNSTEKIDGATTQTLSNDNDFITVRCDGAQWWIIAKS